MPVVDYYRQQGKVVDVSIAVLSRGGHPLSPPPSLDGRISYSCALQIDSSKTIEEVTADIEKGIAPIMA